MKTSSTAWAQGRSSGPMQKRSLSESLATKLFQVFLNGGGRPIETRMRGEAWANVRMWCRSRGMIIASLYGRLPLS
eukprot:1478133-Pyramimonas_sp.AAC.1